MSAHNEYLGIVIPARKNSKRLQSKNLKHFYGFPLFEWSLAAGLFLSLLEFLRAGITITKFSLKAFINITGNIFVIFN